MQDRISFDNTEVAFADRKDRDLKKAYRLFVMMSMSWLVRISTRIAPWSIRKGLPVQGIIRNTIFNQFVGGETLEETKTVADKLSQSNVQVILDYGVEGKEGETSFDKAEDEFIKVIRYASTQTNIPFISIKVTGIARFSLLEKIDFLMHKAESGSLIRRYYEALQQLIPEEVAEWDRVLVRMKNIVEVADETGVGVLVDAEETWIQDPVDAITMLMMDEYNKEKIIIYNTIQLYRHDRLAFLKLALEAAIEKGFMLGAKLVRGAYMEKERKRSIEKKYPSPIQPNKATCDRDYNSAIKFCIDNLDEIGLIVASHNEESSLLTTKLLQYKGLPLDHPRVHFSQLLGMSDNITFNLAKAGCRVSKYVPFGPINDVVPYLMRRAQENTSVGGQTSRELMLIKKEIKRRKS